LLLFGVCEEQKINGGVIGVFGCSGHYSFAVVVARSLGVVVVVLEV
jgi:hypothetical protein